MTDKTTEALKLAEEALEDIIRVYKFETGTPVTTLAAIREALAEPVKQEPVAWDLAEKVRRDLDRQSCPDAYMRIAIESIVKHFPAPPPVQEITEDVDAAMVEMKNIYPPLRRSECERLIRAAKYAAPVSAKREWVDLTDDEIDLIEQQVYCRTTQKGRPLGVYAVELVRAVIAAFKEKNK